MIRPAKIEDLDALVELESNSFETDKLSRRSLRYMLTTAKAEVLIDEESGVTRGYSLVLFNSGASLARLYSIAVNPNFRGQKLGEKLLNAAEEGAFARDCAYIRLEVRLDNETAQKLYIKNGYKKIGKISEYYEDNMDAVRYEKLLAPHLNPSLVKVPYYQQTLDFTCGPASLLMAMNSLDSSIALDRKTEIKIWRESTTIFMTSGHGGCGPYGLALSAHKRGFKVQIFLSDNKVLFLDSVRSPEKKAVMTLVEEGFQEEVLNCKIETIYKSLSIEETKEISDKGGIPIVLISSYKLYHEKFPHWVVVTGFDDKYIYVHDPFVDVEYDKSITDCTNMPIRINDFDKMARYGKQGLKAAVIINK